jgi:methylmalonyl-CoA/ethylmalonyl-CoA epimerase
MPSSSLAGRNLVQAALTVSDLPRAIGFYRDTLGLPFLFETNGMAFFQLGNTRLMVGAGPNAAPSTGVLYFDAPDLPELARALEAKAVTFLGPMQVLQKTAEGDLCLRAFRDPDGNFLALMGVVPPAVV